MIPLAYMYRPSAADGGSWETVVIAVAVLIAIVAWYQFRGRK